MEVVTETHYDITRGLRRHCWEEETGTRRTGVRRDFKTPWTQTEKGIHQEILFHFNNFLLKMHVLYLLLNCLHSLWFLMRNEKSLKNTHIISVRQYAQKSFMHSCKLFNVKRCLFILSPPFTDNLWLLKVSLYCIYFNDM